MNDQAPSRALSPLRSDGKSAPIVPQTFEDVQRLATMAVKAEIGHYGFKDTPEQRVAKATAAIMHGMELGLSPMQSLAGIAVINGKPTIYGDLLTAVLLANGFKVKRWIDGEGDNRIARARITRPDGEVIEDSFSVAQAKQARLWDTRETVQKKSRDGGTYSTLNDSAWFRFPNDMLGWKALGRCARVGASDATRGLMLREDVEGDVIDITPTQPAAATIADVPEIPEIPEPPADVPTIAEPTDEKFSAVEEARFLAQLGEELASAGEHRGEVVEQYVDLLDRLSDAGRRAADRLIEGRV